MQAPNGYGYDYGYGYGYGQGQGQGQGQGIGGVASGAGASGGACEPAGPGYWYGAEATWAEELLQLEEDIPVSLQVAEASARAFGNEVQSFALRVPFLCCLDAEVALQYLSSGMQVFPAALHTDFLVSGRQLFIWLSSWDQDLLHTGTSELLAQLVLIVQTLQHVAPQNLMVMPCPTNATWPAPGSQGEGEGEGEIVIWQRIMKR